MAVDEWRAERKVLRHAHQRVVDRRVAVRVVLAEHLAHDTRALALRPVGLQVELVHRVEDAPVDGLEAVADVGQRAAHDDRHRVRHVRVGDLAVEHRRHGGRAVGCRRG